MPNFEFPAWTGSHFSAKDPQVSHCLNLALPLRNPAVLQLVLQVIVDKQPRIESALGALNILHFARFVPSRQGTHLMVIAEFDGDFEPCVQGLVDGIGDVLDQLLAHCDPQPALPVTENRDEFVTFARRWNQVPVTPGVFLPPDFDYPLFCAYPDKRVGDIIGGSSAKLRQVSHGLNLALPLKNPLVDLPCVLLDIAAAQPRIKQALVELNFLHFARFMPSRDGKFLMVVTEFDGPFEPYVLDFAVCIGDIFDRLLERCSPQPTLPLRQHPEKFLDFVRKWNRVPDGTGGMHPPEFEYPLFSAYPEKTVLDIVGPRAKLPAPVVDRPAAPVDLFDVQGNLLKGYGSVVGRHFVVAVTDADLARPWFAALPVTDAAPWSVARGQLELLNVGFTCEGMQVLWPGRGDDLDGFPDVFKDGPAIRATANGDVGGSSPSSWLFGGAAAPAAHAMVSIYAADPRTLQQRAAAITAAFAANGLAVLHTQDGKSLKGAREPFGFRDGIAQPRIAGQCSRGDDMQPAASPGEFLLGANYSDIYGAPSLGTMPGDIAANGTFCAVRLIEQDVAEFNKLLNHAVIAANNPDTTSDLVAAKLMGRWQDGTPVSMQPTDPEWRAARGAAADRNDFDYAPSYEYPGTPEDHAGTRCPVGAHVRRTNPRSARIAGARHSRRLIRRGMRAAWHEDSTPREGLFGMFFCGSLERQFEFILREWINGDLAASGIRGTQDPIVGSGTLGGKVVLPGIGHGGSALELHVPRLTQTRGSLYLFVPGIAALRAMAPAAAPLAVAAEEPEPQDAVASAAKKGIGLLREKIFHGVAVKSEKALEGMLGTFEAEMKKSVDLTEQTLAQEARNSITGALDEELKIFQPESWNEPWKLHDILYAPADRCTGTPPPAVVPVDPTDARFIADPYPTFAALRQQAPVQYVPAHRAFWVTSRSLVQRLCTEPNLFLQKQGGLLPAGLLTMNLPRHTPVRAAMNEAFSFAMSHQPGTAQQVVRQAVSDLTRLPHMDLAGGFARRIATDNFMQFFGVPKGERAKIDQLARSVMMHADATLDTVQQAIGWRDGAKLVLRLGVLLEASYFEALAEGGLLPHRRFRGNLLQEMALRTAWPGMPGPLTILESVMTALQFTLAGYLSTEFLLATGCRNLLLPQGTGGQRPWDLLVSKAVPLEGALDEARRFDSPLGVIERVAAADLPAGTFAPFAIPKGALLLGFIGSANRDETGWCPGTDLSMFKVNREQEQSLLTLGDGIHNCIGRPLQAVVVPLAMRTLVDEMPNLRLQSPGAVPPWIPNIYFRSFTALPATTCP